MFTAGNAIIRYFLTGRSSQEKYAPPVARENWRAELWTVGLYAALVALIFLFNAHGHGALASPRWLGAELHCSHAEPASWAQGAQIPYSYRWFFRWIVLQICAIVPGGTTAAGFYAVFIGASAVCLLLAVVLLDRFLRATGIPREKARLGGLLFLAGFPIVFAYDMPIHTREDLLGYASVALLLILAVRDRPVLLALVGALAANVRETTTLGLFPYLFLSRRPFWQRVLAVAPAFIVLRCIRPPPGVSHDGYDYVANGLGVNLGAPWESILYMFASFGVLWVLVPLGFRERRRSGRGGFHDIFGLPGLLAIALAMAVNMSLGMMRECRIVYVAAPFVIGFALEYLMSERFAQLLRVRLAWLVATAGLSLGAWVQLEIINQPGLTSRLRPWIGESFQPGFEPARPIMLPNGTKVLLLPYNASPWNGTHVTLHLAALLFVLTGETTLWLARKRSFSPVPAPPNSPPRRTPPRPPDWKMTFDDLMAEAKAGKRPSIGQPELDWARDYERSLIPDGFRFPQKGDLYEAQEDHTAAYVTDWAAPYSGGGDATIPKGEQIWVHSAPREEKPIGADALPVAYKTVEARIVPEAERSCSKYGGFHFYFSTVELNQHFRLVRTGFKGRC